MAARPGTPVSIRLDDDQARTLALLAERNGRTKSDELRAALNAHFTAAALSIQDGRPGAISPAVKEPGA